MIINTIMSGNFSRKNVGLLAPEVFFIKELDEAVILSIEYTNKKSLRGALVVFLNGNIVDSADLMSGETKNINVSNHLGHRGIFSFKVVVTDAEASVDSLEFIVIYNYNIDDYKIVYNETTYTYTLEEYKGSSNIVEIPNVFNDGKNGTLPVTRIDNGVFNNNDTITTVIIPETITSIGAQAFFSCDYLDSVTVLAVNPPVLGSDDVFDPYNAVSLLKIRVPAESVAAYRSALHWSEYANDIVAIQ